MAGLPEASGDRAGPAGWLPDPIREVFYFKQRGDGFGWRLVKVIPALGVRVLLVVALGHVYGGFRAKRLRVM